MNRSEPKMLNRISLFGGFDVLMSTVTPLIKGCLTCDPDLKKAVGLHAERLLVDCQLLAVVDCQLRKRNVISECGDPYARARISHGCNPLITVVEAFGNRLNIEAFERSAKISQCSLAEGTSSSPPSNARGTRRTALKIALCMVGGAERTLLNRFSFPSETAIAEPARRRG